MLARLQRWWHGADAGAAARRARQRRDGAARTPTPGAATRSAQWPAVRVQLVQAVWGRGFAGPGGADRAVDLVKGCGLTKADTVLDIGPGAGGGPLAITTRFRNYVVGHVGNPALAAQATRLAESYGVTDRLEYDATDFETLTVKSGLYRTVLVRDVLHRVANKERLLGQAAAALRDEDGEMILAGLICDGDMSSPAIAEWVAAERSAVRPWTLPGLRSCLASLSLTLRTEEDETAWYRCRVQQAWRNYRDEVADRDLPAEAREILLGEANIWARRLAAIDAGLLGYRRLLAVRRGD
jgi:2-polyprenyl-3-methyl-5-hydroxy-6-metoxy-1,4-benzoquinol methylase